MTEEKKQEQRIKEFLGDNVRVSVATIDLWRGYLLKEITSSVQVAGIEDFPWEEPYIMGGWDADEYEEMKKTNPSYTDEFDLIRIKSESEDLIAELKRVSDKQIFDIPLSWLTVTEGSDRACMLIDDYSIWRYNY